MRSLDAGEELLRGTGRALLRARRLKLALGATAGAADADTEERCQLLIEADDCAALLGGHPLEMMLSPLPCVDPGKRAASAPAPPDRARLSSAADRDPAATPPTAWLRFCKNMRDINGEECGVCRFQLEPLEPVEAVEVLELVRALLWLFTVGASAAD